MIHLVHTNFSGDTLKCAIGLAEKLESGECTGAIIGIMYKRQRYSVDVCGEATRNPTYALGICRVLGAEILSLIHEQGDRNPTL